MRELFLQIVYGRTQTAFSEGGLPIGAGLEDLGKGLRSTVGTMYGTVAKGVRYLEMAEGYVTRLALDENDEVIGYEFVHLGKMMESIEKGVEPAEALKKATSKYGRFDEADQASSTPGTSRQKETSPWLFLNATNAELPRSRTVLAQYGIESLEEAKQI